MKAHRVSMFLLLMALCWFSFTYSSNGTPIRGAQNEQAHAAHILINPAEIKWGPAPPALPPGAQMAVVDGDPSQAGVPFAIRAKFPNGYKVPPHWHPTDENVLVLKGTFMVGMGEKFSEAGAHELREGGFAKMPKEVRHYAFAKGETVIQVYGIGPFEVNYVNASDDPRKKAASK
jgi:quercetin dioxygenase-like cupin family protein